MINDLRISGKVITITPKRIIAEKYTMAQALLEYQVGKDRRQIAVALWGKMIEKVCVDECFTMYLYMQSKLDEKGRYNSNVSAWKVERI